MLYTKAEEEKRKAETETGQSSTADAKLIQKEVKNGILHKVKQNSKWGFADGNGTITIPCQWEDAYEFSEDLAAVKDESGRWGYIDKTGKLLIPCC